MQRYAKLGPADSGKQATNQQGNVWNDRIIVNLRYALGCIGMQTTQPQQKKAYQK
jgi:hypothetical protein